MDVDVSLNEELNNFRNTWKQELTTKSTSSNGKKRKFEHHTEVSGESAEEPTVADGTRHNSKSEELKHPLKRQNKLENDIDHVRQQPNTLESFLLAERLLQQSSSTSTSRPTKCATAGSSQSDTQQGNHRPELQTKRKEETAQNEVQGLNKSNSFLDVFLADLEEINEIPFFEISVPRELAVKMFKYLDRTSLCRCAQVSKAWKSLAEDEVLWCKICHQLGYENDSQPVDQQNWKEIVKRHILEKRHLQANWKTRTGRVGRLQHVQGGILCAVHSLGDKIVAGYTNGDVKFWRLQQNADECIFRPSVQSLELDPTHEVGTVSNIITDIVVNASHVMAGYSQGYVDIWSQEGDTRPLFSFRGPHSPNCLALSSDMSVVAAGFSSHIITGSFEGPHFTKVDAIDITVHQLRLIRSTECRPVLIISCGDTIKAHIPGAEVEAMATISEVYGQQILTMDVSAEQVAFGYSNYLYNTDYGVHIYDVRTRQRTVSLQGYTAAPSCVNLEYSPSYMLVTGCRSSIVRVYDVRVREGFPVMTFQGHQRGVSVVQMDEWKVVSGANDGLVAVWDQRMAAKLWELHNRHPVKYAHFEEDLLITANIPVSKFVQTDLFDSIPPLRCRGSVHAYDFSANQDLKGLPSICSSTYDEPEAYNYNIRLAVPYDCI